MTSEQGTLGQNQIVSNPGVSASSTAAVLQNLNKVDTGSMDPKQGMLAFLKANGPAQPVKSPIDPQAVSTKAAAQQNKPQPNAAQSSAAEPSLNIPGTTPASSDEDLYNPELEATKQPQPDKQPTQENKKDAAAPDILEEEFPEEPSAQATRFKQFRTKLKEITKSLKEKEEKLEVLQKQVADYETGTVVPEVIQQKEGKIAELEKYKYIVDFKASPDYDEKFVKPLEQLDSKLSEIAADYEIPKEVIEDALKTTNRAELNRFLSSHFDDVGALEVKQIVTKMKDIHEQAREFEKEPLKALAQLKEENRRVNEVREYQRKTSIANTSKEAWGEVLSGIRQEGKIQELIIKDSDTQHNDSYVKPILTAAATEYAKIIKSIADLGAKELPKREAMAIAKAFLLAHASAVSLQTRNDAVNYANTLEKNVARTTRYIRPTLGSSSANNGSAPSKSVEETPQEAGRNLMNKVLANRRG